MDALPFIKQILSEPALRVILSDNVDADSQVKIETAIYTYENKYAKNLKDHSDKDKADLIQCLRLKAREIGKIMRETTSGLSRHLKVTDRKNSLNCKIQDMVSNNYFKHTKAEGELVHKYIDVVINSVAHTKETRDLFRNKEVCSNCLTDIEKGRAFFLMTVFPALRELNDPYKILDFLIELSIKLDNLPQLIFEKCKGQTLELLLIGSLLSLKPMAYNTWKEVKDGLAKITESDNDATNNFRKQIFSFCYDDLPDFLKPCFLYLACYPIDYEISARSLTQIWIAENFVTKENEETIEDTANKYLEQLVQRSLVWVSKRSLLGTIKYCRVNHSIHEFVIQQSKKDDFLIANPELEKMKLANRVAIHHDEKKQYKDQVEQNRDLHSFLAFKFVRNVYNGCPMNLYVLELRKSAIPEIDLPDMSYLRYLGLRGSIIPELPANIGDMKNLQTLDVRDTSIEILPESLWNISTLRHVHANPSSKIKGPPSTAKISDLQILKAIAVPLSWNESVPLFLINLRKLALSNANNLAWKSISILLSNMVNLLSMAIIGDILPSEFVDIRAFPNLETVKSIQIGGKWTCKKLFIDNIKFPPNLKKLTLTNSELKEDPMPTLEKLQALEVLRLQSGAYIGNQMVCSENGFPQLRFLEISELENLELWEVTPMAMSQLTTLHVVKCLKLKNLPDLKHVTDIVLKERNVEQSLSLI